MSNTGAAGTQKVGLKSERNDIMFYLHFLEAQKSKIFSTDHLHNRAYVQYYKRFQVF